GVSSSVKRVRKSVALPLRSAIRTSQCNGNAVHGDRALQGRRRCARLSAISGSRPHGAARPRVRRELGRHDVLQMFPGHATDEWMANWSDLINFEVSPVLTSKDAADAISPRL